MAKVRVPKIKRPPTRFGIITPEMGNLPDAEAVGKKFRVKCYRVPKLGEFFWYSNDLGYGCGHAKISWLPRLVILEEVED